MPRNVYLTVKQFIFIEGVELNEVPSEKLLNRIAGKLVKNRQRLGRELKLKEEVILEIMLNYSCVKEQAYQILYNWTTIYGAEATYKRLIKGLAVLNEKKLIEQLPQIGKPMVIK